MPPPSPRTPRRRPGPRPLAGDTRGDVFRTAAEMFSARGFDSVGVDEIAAAAGVNKAMIYYHFADKLTLYRETVREMLRAVGEVAAEVAAMRGPAENRMIVFITGLISLADERPWFPPLMLREMAEGGPRLDAETLGLMKAVFTSFGRILADGERDGTFRAVNPVLAYMSIIGPLLLNAARERAAARPGRAALPMFAAVPRSTLIVHLQQAALRLLAPEPKPE